LASFRPDSNTVTKKSRNDLGIAQNHSARPASYIGSFESNLKDLTFRLPLCFPTPGVRQNRAYIIERIDDQTGTKPI